MPTAPKPSLHLRLPPDVHAEAAAQAEMAGISLNAWLTLGVRNWTAYKRREFQHAAALPVDHRHAPAPAKAVSREKSKVGRNAPCPCGSGRKFKVCHGQP